MLKRFTAQNINGELYTALDFTESNAFLYYAPNGDLNDLKKFIQLMWASTTEDGISFSFTQRNLDHTITSTTENIYLDNNPVKINDVENLYEVLFPNYSKVFILTYTQLLNLELGRIPATRYLNQYVFHKADSKSYYSPVEDIFYDIEQAKKYSSSFSESEKQQETDEQFNKEKMVADIKKKISDLERLKTNGGKDSELGQKISNLEKKVEDQRIQDELIAKKESLLGEVEILSEKARNYQEDLQKVSQLEVDMSKYKSYMRLDSQRVENDINVFTYRIREREKVLSDLANNRIEYVENYSHFAYLPFAVLITVSLAIGITLSILMNLILGLILGFLLVTSTLLYFVFHRKNKIEPKQSFSQETVSAISNEISALKSAKVRYLNNLGFNNEDDYYATKALVKALTFQKDADIAKIHEKFEGLELSDLRSKIEERQRNLTDLEKQIQSYGEPISPEDYVKLRRELDMLKLEYANTSGVSNMEDIDGQISQLQQQIVEIQTVKQEKGINNNLEIYSNILKEYFGEELNVDDKYEISGLNLQNYEQKVELFVISRLAYIKSNFVSAEIPMILEDPFVGIENLSLIDKIIDFCSKYIQVVLVSEHDKYFQLNLKKIKP